MQKDYSEEIAALALTCGFNINKENSNMAKLVLYSEKPNGTGGYTLQTMEIVAGKPVTEPELKTYLNVIDSFVGYKGKDLGIESRYTAFAELLKKNKNVIDFYEDQTYRVCETLRKDVNVDLENTFADRVRQNVDRRVYSIIEYASGKSPRSVIQGHAGENWKKNFEKENLREPE